MLPGTTLFLSGKWRRRKYTRANRCFIFAENIGAWRATPKELFFVEDSLSQGIGFFCAEFVTVRNYRKAAATRPNHPALCDGSLLRAMRRSACSAFHITCARSVRRAMPWGKTVP